MALELLQPMPKVVELTEEQQYDDLQDADYEVHLSEDEIDVMLSNHQLIFEIDGKKVDLVRVGE